MGDNGFISEIYTRLSFGKPTAADFDALARFDTPVKKCLSIVRQSDKGYFGGYKIVKFCTKIKHVSVRGNPDDIIVHIYKTDDHEKEKETVISKMLEDGNIVIVLYLYANITNISYLRRLLYIMNVVDTIKSKNGDIVIMKKHKDDLVVILSDKEKALLTHVQGVTIKNTVTHEYVKLLDDLYPDGTRVFASTADEDDATMFIVEKSGDFCSFKTFDGFYLSSNEILVESDQQGAGGIRDFNDLCLWKLGEPNIESKIYLMNKGNRTYLHSHALMHDKIHKQVTTWAMGRPDYEWIIY